MSAITYNDLTILFEDNHILVVVKPQNLPSQGDSSGDKNMLDLLKAYIKERYDKPGNVFLGLVHRLDRPAGGVMVFAKTSKGAERLAESMNAGEFDKKYLAVTCGTPPEKHGRLTHYLLKDEAQNMVYTVPMSTRDAKIAVLDYRVLDTKEGLSLLYVDLYTGRSHQIRAQMKEINCPLAGDVKYGGEKADIKCNLALWSTVLRFPHPVTRETMTFIVYPPESFPWKNFDVATHLAVTMKE